MEIFVQVNIISVVDMLDPTNYSLPLGDINLLRSTHDMLLMI